MNKRSFIIVRFSVFKNFRRKGGNFYLVVDWVDPLRSKNVNV
jgi:hypothetical protein